MDTPTNLPLDVSPRPPKLRRDWVGKRVRITNEIRNGIMTIPVGAICTVRNIYRGADLVGPACKCCGVAIHISKVPWTDLEYLGENKKDE